jgi:hypothetical protein
MFLCRCFWQVVLLYMLHEIGFGVCFGLTLIPLTLKAQVRRDIQRVLCGGDMIEQVVVELEQRGKREIAMIPMAMVAVIIILRGGYIEWRRERNCVKGCRDI